MFVKTVSRKDGKKKKWTLNQIKSIMLKKSDTLISLAVVLLSDPHKFCWKQGRAGHTVLRCMSIRCVGGLNLLVLYRYTTDEACLHGWRNLMLPQNS